MGRAVNDPPVEGRLIQTFMYLRSCAEDNHYAHPLDFLPVVDLNLCKVASQFYKLVPSPTLLRLIAVSKGLSIPSQNPAGFSC